MPTDDVFDVETLRVGEEEQRRVAEAKKAAHASRPKAPRSREDAWFIKGPLPYRWVEKAAALPGKALALGLYLWFRAGRERQDTLTVPLRGLPFSLTSTTAFRAIHQLEEARLIRVRRQPGRPLVVTVLRKGGGRRRKS